MMLLLMVLKLYGYNKMLTMYNHYIGVTISIFQAIFIFGLSYTHIHLILL